MTGIGHRMPEVAVAYCYLYRGLEKDSVPGLQNIGDPRGRLR